MPRNSQSTAVKHQGTLNSPYKSTMLLVSLFASVARTFAPTGTAKSFRQEELCPLLGLPSDLVVATLLPHLQDTRDLVSRKRTATVHCVRFPGSCTEPSEACS